MGTDELYYTQLKTAEAYYRHNQIGEAKNILVGGHDEMTEKHHRVYNRIGYWKKDDAVDTMQLINSKTTGSVAGEGASFFILGK